MLRYKTETRPGLVALYDIWPGNGASLFLQPRSPHGATFMWSSVAVYTMLMYLLVVPITEPFVTQ